MKKPMGIMIFSAVLLVLSYQNCGEGFIALPGSGASKASVNAQVNIELLGAKEVVKTMAASVSSAESIESVVWSASCGVTESSVQQDFTYLFSCEKEGDFQLSANINFSNGLSVEKVSTWTLFAVISGPGEPDGPVIEIELSTQEILSGESISTNLKRAEVVESIVLNWVYVSSRGVYFKKLYNDSKLGKIVLT